MDDTRIAAAMMMPRSMPQLCRGAAAGRFRAHPPDGRRRGRFADPVRRLIY
jgi:hypothetical protein